MHLKPQTRKRDVWVAMRVQKGVICSCELELVLWDKLKPSLGGVVGRDNTSLGLCFNISK